MKIFMTGASGIIGRTLMKGLSHKYRLIGIDRVSSDNVITLDILSQPRKLRELVKNIDVVIHLAWDSTEAGSDLRDPVVENKTMGEIMYQLALEHRIKKFVLASSVHVSFGHIEYKHPGIVENHQTLHTKKIDARSEFYPLGTYGASKVYLEALGKAYSAKGLQVVAVRFGNVTADNHFGEYPFWLSHRDCCQFIERCLEATDLPQYSTFFAISDNPCNPFDISEAKTRLDYKPRDKSPCPNQIN